MIVELFTQNNLEDNINSISKTFYAASTLICVPNSLDFNVSALDSQPGEEKRDIAKKSGFSHFKRTIDTSINIIPEIKPSFYSLPNFKLAL